MAKKGRGSAPVSASSPKESSKKGTPVRCVGEDCHATTLLVFPGSDPFVGAQFKDKGWSALNEPDKGEIVFACQSCFVKEMEESEDSDDDLDDEDA